MTPLIIEAATNGGTKKDRNPRVPITPEEVVADGLACLEAGATILHTHIESLRTVGAEGAERYLAAYRPLMAARPDAILCPTAGVAPTMEERWRHVEVLAESGLIRMGVLDPGSVNSANSGENGLPGTMRHVYSVPFEEIEYLMAVLDRGRLGPSIAVYEPGYLHTTLAYHRAGRLPQGAMVKLYYAGDHNFMDGRKGGFNFFGLLPTRAGFEAYYEMVAQSGLAWSVALPGGDVGATPLARLAIERGGHVRVGLEDFAGDRQPSNTELVREIVAIAREVGRPIATCDQAREILGLRR